MNNRLDIVGKIPEETFRLTMQREKVSASETERSPPGRGEARTSASRNECERRLEACFDAPKGMSHLSLPGCRRVPATSRSLRLRERSRRSEDEHREDGAYAE